MEFITNKFKVRYHESDQMGFVHHSNYLKYFEKARIDWLDSIGLSYSEIEKKGIILPVVSAKIKFIYPAFFGDKLKIKLTVSSPPTVKIDFNYVVFNQDEKVIATGETRIAFLDSNLRKPIRCPMEISEKILDIQKP